MSSSIHYEKFIVFYYPEKVPSKDESFPGVELAPKKPMIIAGLKDLLVHVEALSRHNTKFSVYCLGECIGDFT